MCRIQNKKSILLMILILIIGLLLPVNPIKAQSAKQVTIKLHKMQYSETVTEVQNTGEEISITGAESYDKNKYGMVEFTLYKLNSNGTAAVTAELKKPNASLSEIAKSLAADEQMYETPGIEEEVDDNGIATFENLTADGTYYLIVETMSPTRFVVKKARPMLIQLPVTNQSGTQTLDVVHLYPKNQVQTMTLNFAKLQSRIGQGEQPLPGAEFDLYKGYTADAENAVKVNRIPIKTAADGSFKLENLTPGEFFLVERDSVVVDGNVGDQAANEQRRLIAGSRMLKHVENKLCFSVSTDGHISWPMDSIIRGALEPDTHTLEPDTHTYKIINYEKPSITKENLSGGTANEFGSRIPFKIEIQIPEDIQDYSVFECADTPKVQAGSSSDMLDTDMLKVIKSTIRAKIGDSALSTDLTLDTDYVIPDADEEETAGFIIRFVDEYRGVPDILKNNAGKTITIQYDAELSSNMNADVLIHNIAELTFQNGATGAMRKEKSETEVTTYGMRFKKMDTGFLGTGIAGTALQDAEFILYHTNLGENDKRYFTKTNGKYGWHSDASKAFHFKSAADGLLDIVGLKNSTYYLKEVKAPRGYKLLDSPIQFTPGPGTHDESKTITIRNSRTTPLPMTGREQVFLVAGGLLLLLLAGVVMGRYKRKQNRA